MIDSEQVARAVYETEKISYPNTLLFSKNNNLSFHSPVSYILLMKIIIPFIIVH
jgi:hypothetical protein